MNMMRQLQPNKLILAGMVLLVLMFIFHCWTNRYFMVAAPASGRAYKLDKWTGKMWIVANEIVHECKPFKSEATLKKVKKDKQPVDLEKVYPELAPKIQKAREGGYSGEEIKAHIEKHVIPEGIKAYIEKKKAEEKEK